MANSKLKPFRVTRRVLYTSILFVALTFCGYAYFFHAIQKTGQNTATLEQETTALEAQEAEIGQLRINLVSTEAERGQIASYFIEPTDIIPFLETIEAYAKSVGVKVKFNSVALAKDPTSLKVTLVAEGPFTGIYRFTALIEAAPYEIAFDNADIQYSPSTDQAPKKGPLPPEVWTEQISLSVLSIGTAK